MNSVVVSKNRSAAVTAKVKRLLIRKHGNNGIRVLSRSLGVANDVGGNSTVSKDVFLQALSNHDISLTPEDIAAVWAEYDRNGTGLIDPVDFLASLRRGLSPERRTLIERAWSTFPKNHAGAVTVSALLRAYRAASHPRVVRGEATAAEIQKALEGDFSVETNPDGTVSAQEFEQYYAAVSASVDDDEIFASLMRGCWDIAGADAYFTSTLALTTDSKVKSYSAIQPIQSKRTVTEAMRQKDAFQAVVDVHRATLLASKGGFRVLGRLLRQKDVQQNGYVSVEVFLDALWQCRLYVEDKSILPLLDTNNDNTVDVLLYLNYVVPELPAARQVMLEALWSTFSIDKHHRADIAELHKRFQSKDGAARNAFLNAWDRRQAGKDGRVTFKEMVEYYVPVSLATPMDVVFQQTLKSEWC